ncbi:putative N-acetylmannosamine-6-phosphate 2-epimerase [Streptomyces sp. NPDC051940]|uniref:N-acetylmannosamine-6-phosphate 2-epimerase n=1 Tax=Streptomyces sp. NPDC051940 TaxID=3155675 RepID=UPI00342C091E
MTVPPAGLLPPHALIVSCQARPGHPLHGPGPMALMARAAAAGGAAAIRAEGAADIRAIRAETALPLVGLRKQGDPSGVFITPTFETAAEVVRAGATLVALDATDRPRPGGVTPAGLIRRIRSELGVPVVADVDSLAAGRAAAGAGADYVATTLSGYTGGGPAPDGPDLELVGRLAATTGRPVIAEGRYRTPDDVRRAREAGAYAVVVGQAITDPMAMTGRLAAALGTTTDERPGT